MIPFHFNNVFGGRAHCAHHDFCKCLLPSSVNSCQKPETKLHLLFPSLHQPEPASLGIHCAFWPFQRIIFTEEKRSSTLPAAGEREGLRAKAGEQGRRPHPPRAHFPIPFSYKHVHQLSCLALQCVCRPSLHAFERGYLWAKGRMHPTPLPPL